MTKRFVVMALGKNNAVMYLKTFVSPTKAHEAHDYIKRQAVLKGWQAKLAVSE